MGAGVGHTSPWLPSLDGLLAAQLWAEAKHTGRVPEAGGLDVDVPDDLDLPLARCDQGSDWHWAATCGWPDPPGLPVESRAWTGRLDHTALEALCRHLPGVVSSTQGRYRTRRMPLLTTRCGSVQWTGVGDPDQILRLLSPVTTIGKKRRHGEGEVLSWKVEQVDADPYTAAHLYPDGRLGRPAPAGCVAGRPVETGGTGTVGIRPPVMHPARWRTLLLPAHHAC